MTHRRIRWAEVIAAAALVGLSVAAPAQGVGAQDCAAPTVNVLTSVEAAVTRPALRSPAEYGLSNVYAMNELATKPQFVYSEAGPQYAGAFEALAPAGTPPPPRSVAAHPSQDIPDDDEEDWGGRSRSTVTPVSAFASSVGAPPLGIGIASDVARSFATTVVECDVITVIAGWSAADVVAPDGTSFELLGETVTLVVGPSGSSSSVEVTAVAPDGTSLVPLAGRPLDPLTDPIRDNGGPSLDVGEARTATAPGSASASGGGFDLLFTDPESGQGAAFRIGSVQASIEVLGPLVANSARPGSIPAVPPSTGSTPSAAAAGVGDRTSVTGAPPAPSSSATELVETVLVQDISTQLLEVGRRDWRLAAALAALLTLAAATGGAFAVGRHRYPTLDWIARRSERGSVRFVRQYLRW